MKYYNCIMDLLICEYIFDEIVCVTYLKCINIDPEKYEYVYKEFEHMIYTYI